MYTRPWEVIYSLTALNYVSSLPFTIKLVPMHERRKILAEDTEDPMNPDIDKSETGVHKSHQQLNNVVHTHRMRPTIRHRRKTMPERHLRGLSSGSAAFVQYDASEDELRFHLGLTGMTTSKGKVNLQDSSVCLLEWDFVSCGCVEETTLRLDCKKVHESGETDNYSFLLPTYSSLPRD
ncbi:hypothetical protein L2E82_38855 [Cichorium intybus]|uniref:Uncharacterized protein n=1 Tax=Cichorium intybus TaxID=13427 RepID=A0ACB9AG20_CICIN|nr:hypothetical protein L2E82_38855 [Cichorium intybus]